ncbi:BirA family biotin operon repressor/biotin-[acetyl-CoA-carboxylase] ligase [Herbaspirillum sp. SJZ130]|nr:BirA family biotin operon repressor/biotin-[acetyl-CoA-carboxylase] ligase [Herbaspirillum sp. SJZ102]TQK09281.1 BirA family biotin operon repressor/biotin-[acetyl-CoA-carboxylase] ligase [Herbaspirillum sp. SJZ130]TQK14032.1 BirA family biotin operon repressor/biotin-[acetyl-CoA-carboxylase] ligase [Herbaspirillum sp. SJZ106]
MNKTSHLPAAALPEPAFRERGDGGMLVQGERVAKLLAGSDNANVKDIVVEAVAQTGSTNADLMQRLPTLALPVLRVADCQSAGRGRAGRAWRTAPETSLTFSLAWRFERPLHALLGLPLAVGVALAEALQVLGVQAQLKWPNDVLRDGAKLAGVLIETAADGGAGQATWAVIGIGLNLGVPPDLEFELGRAIGTAPELQKQPRETVLAIITSALADVLVEFERYGFGAFIARWQAFHSYAGQPVKIIDNGRIVQEGIAAGVDVMGRFLIDTGAGQAAVLAGDVSLRLQEQAS